MYPAERNKDKVASATIEKENNTGKKMKLASICAAPDAERGKWNLLSTLRIHACIIHCIECALAHVQGARKQGHLRGRLPQSSNATYQDLSENGLPPKEKKRSKKKGFVVTVENPRYLPLMPTRHLSEKKYAMIISGGSVLYHRAAVTPFYVTERRKDSFGFVRGLGRSKVRLFLVARLSNIPARQTSV